MQKAKRRFERLKKDGKLNQRKPDDRSNLFSLLDRLEQQGDPFAPWCKDLLSLTPDQPDAIEYLEDFDDDDEYF
ncbi:MAG: hypothetical protein KME10_11775 [Plectolyngbya sp. WJT66-NPBG17]|jgi:hypothetical protein|nr:hypothetical protein [Plectolyngbya sp. WJT66-NPBG17]